MEKIAKDNDLSMVDDIDQKIMEETTWFSTQLILEATGGESVQDMFELDDSINYENMGYEFSIIPNTSTKYNKKFSTPYLFEYGKIRHYKKDQKFGFMTSEKDNSDIFFHENEFKKAGLNVNYLMVNQIRLKALVVHYHDRRKIVVPQAVDERNNDITFFVVND